MTNTKKFTIAGIIVVVVIAGIVFGKSFSKNYMHDQIMQKFRDEFGDKAVVGNLTTTFSPLTATLTNIEMRSSTNEPVIKIDRVDLLINSEAIRDSKIHLEEMHVKGFHVRIMVDERGESSFSKFIRELPPSKRTVPLPIDILTLDGADFSTFVAPGKPDAQPESLLTVNKVTAHNYVIPPPGKLLGDELWTSVVIDGIEASSPAATGGRSQGQRSIKVGSTTFELAQAASLDTPVRLRKFKAERAECLTEYTQGAVRPAIVRMLNAIQQGFGVKEPTDIKAGGPPRPHGTGLLIEDLSIAGAMIETRGNDAKGLQAYWRLKDARIEAQQLAFGDQTKGEKPGFIRVSSATEAASGPGRAEVSLNNLSGTYPRISFTCDYRIENLAATVFSQQAQSSQQSGILRGTMSMAFAGTATDGNLNIDGSVTLSNDFEVDGSVLEQFGVKLVRGEPLKPVTIRGTIENPQISIPKDLAFMQDMMGNLIFGGPIAIVDTVFGKVPFVGPAMTTGLKEVKKGLNIFKKIGDAIEGDNK